MQPRCLLAAFLLALPVRAAAAEPGNQLPADAATGVLISKLGHPDFAIREQATRALASRGPAVLGQMRRAISAADPEAARRLEELICKAEQSMALAPTRVTLHLNNRPVRDAVRDLARCSGYRFDLPPDAPRDKRPHSFHMERVTFWEAVDRLVETGEVGLPGFERDGCMRVLLQESLVPFVYRSGPFRVVANRFYHTREIDFAQLSRELAAHGRRSESLELGLAVECEPKVPILEVGTPEVQAARDDADRPMTMPRHEGYDGSLASLISLANGSNSWRGNGAGEKSYHVDSRINLVRPSDRSRAVKILRGAIPLTLFLKEVPDLLFDDVLRGTGRPLTGAKGSLTVEDIAKESETHVPGYRIALTLNRSLTQGPRDNLIGWPGLYQRVALEDARGRAYQLVAADSETETPNPARISFQFVKPGDAELGPPARFVCYRWDTFSYRLSFEFRDLPLP
jgi:hypothetical protein